MKLKNLSKLIFKMLSLNRLKIIADVKEEFSEKIEKMQVGLLEVLMNYTSIKPTMEGFF